MEDDSKLARHLPKTTNGETDFIYSPEDGATIVNGFGGAGMTLSFGLAEEVMNNLGIIVHKEKSVQECDATKVQ